MTDTTSGTHLYVGRAMTSCDVVETPLGRIAVYSNTCPGREQNEDGAAIVRVGAEQLVLVVADGVGGHPAGAEAASRAIEAVVDRVQRLETPEALGAAVVEGFDAANAAVRSMGSGAATTLSVVELWGGSMRSYHAGDSTVLVTGQRGKVKLQTLSHSPTGYAVEAGLLDEADAIHHEERHVVSNLVGAEDMRIEIGPVLHLKRWDTIVMGTDGLFDNLTLDEVVAVARAGPLEAVAEALAGLGRHRMEAPTPDTPHKPDDLTFLLFRPA